MTIVSKEFCDLFIFLFSERDFHQTVKVSFSPHMYPVLSLYTVTQGQFESCLFVWVYASLCALKKQNRQSEKYYLFPFIVI